MDYDGVNALAAAVAWWLDHPWRAFGFYLLGVGLAPVIRAFVRATAKILLRALA